MRRGRKSQSCAPVRAVAGRDTLLVLALGVLVLVAAPVARAAGAGRVRVSAFYAVRSGRVTAHGFVSRAGAASSARSGSRVELEEELVSSSGASEWRVRASTTLPSQARPAPFTLRLNTSQAAGTITLRTSVVSGSRVLARGSSRTIRLGPALVVKSTLRPTTVRDAAGDVESVSGSPGATQTVLLARGATVPDVGGALILGVSAHAPNGLLGVVTEVSRSGGGATTVTTRPATLEEAYSSFDAQINGTLGELANEDASGAAHAADVSIGSFANVAFSCDDPGVQHSITHSINLSELHVSSEIVIPSWSNGYSGPFINFDLGGHPKFDLGVSFGGYASCTADATVNIPLADTGLFVEIGPQFTLGASGTVSVNMDWEPWVNYGFSRGRDDPSNNYEAFHNDGHTTFSGDADLNVSLGLKAGISLAGRLGVGGTVGPEITGQVSASTATRAACLTVDAEVVAELTAYADVFFDDYNFTLGRFAFGHVQLYHACTGSTSGGPGGGGSGGSSGGDGSGGSGGGSGSGGSGSGNGGGGSGGSGSENEGDSGGTWVAMPALGPTEGPIGLLIPYEIPECPTPSGTIKVFAEYVDHQPVLLWGGIPWDPRFDTFDIFPQEPGTHRVSFACFPATAEEWGSGAVWNAARWAAPAIWKSEGFNVQVTQAAIPAELSDPTPAQGAQETTTAGAPAGPYRCPAVDGESPWGAVEIQLSNLEEDRQVINENVVRYWYDLAEPENAAMSTFAFEIPPDRIGFQPGEEMSMSVICKTSTFAFSTPT